MMHLNAVLIAHAIHSKPLHVLQSQLYLLGELISKHESLGSQEWADVCIHFV